ncbi:MAG TPA: hypothetical protein DEV93_03125 [Chloroflexi bacterium]|jgi:hypothetical protein|nr:hypothetical protein [Chloroflexota bacterium]
MTINRQIGSADKQTILDTQGLRCFVDNHPLEPEDIEFDHILPFTGPGETAIANIAAVCKKHNREKGSLSLSEYRDRLELRRFFDGAKKRRLDDLLSVRLGPHGFGQPLTVETTPNGADLYLEAGHITVRLEECPATHEQYFFATLPASVLRNDTELQPRVLESDRVWELYRHLRTHTQLAPAVCRLVGDSVLLFDGQHKAAAQVWAGRTMLDCKVYINPELRRLKETNLSAHDKLRQMPFYTSTLLEKYAAMASEDWQSFIETQGPKTESAFVEFIRARVNLSRAEAIKRVRSMIYKDVLDHPDNQLRDYITEENRGRVNPLTMSRLNKTFFTEFIAAPPLNDEFETDAYHRPDERENLVRLLNIIVERSLAGRWAPERKDAAHKKAERLYGAGALRAWIPFLRDAIAPTLGIIESEERKRILYRPLTEAHFSKMEHLVDRLLSHKVWEDLNPALNDLRYDDAERAKGMLKGSGLTPSWIVGGES